METSHHKNNFITEENGIFSIQQESKLPISRSSNLSQTASSKTLINASGLMSANNSTGSEIHPLRYTWVFWFMFRLPGQKIVNYEKEIKRISAFSSVEDFWAVYQHLTRAYELPTTSDYLLFKEGIRPVWEDDSNRAGGKWIIRIKKGLAARYWENLIIAVIGDQFDVGEEICGCVLSIRHSEDIISIWNRSANNNDINNSIKNTLKMILDLPNETVMEYKSNDDALRDNSSFRNTNVYK